MGDNEKEADRRTKPPDPDPPRAPTLNTYNESISYPDYKIVIQAKRQENKPQFICSQKVGKLLMEKFGCSKQSIIDINRLARSKLVVTLNSARVANAIVSNTEAKNEYNIFIPAVYTCRYAIIKGINLDFSDEELLENIDSRQHRLIKIQRLNRRKINEDGKPEYVSSKTVRLLFEGADIPQHVYLYCNKIICEPCVMPVRQCMKCYRFGHSTKYCRGEPKCRACNAEYDNSHVCSASNPHCINCKENHIATASECPEREKQSNIKKMMSIRRVLYQEALQTFSDQNENTKYSVVTSNKFEILSNSEFPSLSNKHKDTNIAPYVPPQNFVKIPFSSNKKKPTINLSIKKKGNIQDKEPLAKRQRSNSKENQESSSRFSNKPLLGVSYGRDTSTVDNLFSQSSFQSSQSNNKYNFNISNSSQATEPQTNSQHNINIQPPSSQVTQSQYNSNISNHSQGKNSSEWLDEDMEDKSEKINK